MSWFIFLPCSSWFMMAPFFLGQLEKRLFDIVRFLPGPREVKTNALSGSHLGHSAAKFIKQRTHGCITRIVARCCALQADSLIGRTAVAARFFGGGCA
jgi:hypothetical protein